MPYWEGFLWGVVGGLLVEAAGIYALRRQAPDTWPRWTHMKSYWLITLGLGIPGGGLVVVVYLAAHIAMTPILAANIGATGPFLAETGTRAAFQKVEPSDRIAPE